MLVGIITGKKKGAKTKYSTLNQIAPIIKKKEGF
jgi:hypothetical protein